VSPPLRSIPQLYQRLGPKIAAAANYSPQQRSNENLDGLVNLHVASDQWCERTVAVGDLGDGEGAARAAIDKLDGKIGGDFFDKFSGEWRAEQQRLRREIDRYETTEQSYMEEGVQVFELARNAQRLFERQEPREKWRLLNFLLSNCSW
jgi:hypothetical protein